MQQSEIVRVYVALIGALLIAHWLAVDALVEFWSLSLVYDYGGWLSALVLLVVGVELARIGVVTPSNSKALLFITASLSLALALASVAALMLAQMALLPLLILAAIAGIAGLYVSKRFAWLFLALVFSWPVWDFLIGPLQQLTIEVNSMFFGLTGRTALIEGDTVILPSGSFIIERGCAGLNFFLVGMTLGTLAGYWLTNSIAVRLSILVAALMFSIVANWIRVFGIILIGDMSNMQHSIVEDHALFGWFVFAAAMLGFILLANRLAASPTEAAQDGLSRDDEGEGQASRRSSSVLGKRLSQSLVAVAVVAPPVLVMSVITLQASPRPVVVSLPASVGEWALSPRTLTDTSKAPRFESASSLLSGSYTNAGRRIEVWTASYRLTLDGPELVGYPNAWYRGRHWRATRPSEIEVLGTAPAASFDWMLLSAGEQRRVVVGAYVFGNRLTSSTLEAKRLRTQSMLSGDGRALGFVASMDCSEECDSEVVHLEQFLSDMQAVGFKRLWTVAGTQHTEAN